jgi:hypothetical protein
MFFYDSRFLQTPLILDVGAPVFARDPHRVSLNSSKSTFIDHHASAPTPAADTIRDSTCSFLEIMPAHLFLLETRFAFG